MEARKFLIVGPAWIGDMVMAQTLFKVIMRRYPKSTIDVLAPAWTLPILARMPEVTRAIELPFGHGDLRLREQYQFAKTLRSENYEHAIILKNSFKSALIPFWAKIPRRTAWRGEMRYGLINDMRKLDKNKYPLMIQRFMALGLPRNLKIPTDKAIFPRLIVNSESVNQTLQSLNIQLSDKPILALCPGAEYGPAKRWPAEHFAAVANEKIRQGWQVWIFGSSKEADLTAEIQAKTNNQCVNFAGAANLAQAVDLLSLAQAVVTNDSGLMHVAAALQKPTIAIYGSSSPKFTPPLGDKVKIMSLNLPCSPCFRRKCPLKHLKCLRDLMPMQVLTALKELTQREAERLNV